MQIPSAVIAFQFSRHKEQKSPPFAKTAKGRAPSRQHPEVKSINGMLCSYHVTSRNQNSKGGPPAPISHPRPVTPRQMQLAQGFVGVDDALEFGFCAFQPEVGVAI